MEIRQLFERNDVTTNTTNRKIGAKNLREFENCEIPSENKKEVIYISYKI